MALPKLNATPLYDMVVPSTGLKVNFRPYLVKEEKILLIAFESQDTKTILKAMLDVIINCVEEEIDSSTLATFDVEYMFLKIRAKSVGEKSNITVKCKECKEDNPIEVNLDIVEMEMPEMDNIIKLTDDISIEMGWPTYNRVLNSTMMKADHKTGTEDVMELIASTIIAIHTPDERVETKYTRPEELQEFIEQFTTQQFGLVKDYLDKMPQLKQSVGFKCEKCGADNTRELAGMADFF